MKKLLTVMIALCSFLIAADKTGEELLDTVIRHMNPESAKGIMKQTIVTTSGDKRVLTYESTSNEGGKNSIMRYLTPSRVRGNAMLMKNFSDDIWMYNSRTKRVRKLASHAKKQKFEGSDFTYEDMGSGDSWKEDYSPKNLGVDKYDGEKCTILELSAKNVDVSYSKIVCYLRNEDYFPVKLDYYEDKGNLEKILYLKNIEIIQEIPTAMLMIMENQQDNTSTEMEYEKVQYNVKFPKNYFSEKNLKK